jgi:ribose-phosphate pyrophosphokinase
MNAIFVPMPGNETLAAYLATHSNAETVIPECRQFPDTETYIRLAGQMHGRRLVIVCSLDRPDAKFLPLAFMAATARDLGVIDVGLVAPYLPYMRQDRAFKDGESVTSIYFARQLSGIVDWILTTEPHLHRHHSLAELYSIRAHSAHAASAIAAWVKLNVRRPLIIGPDEESRQWVSCVAAQLQAPFAIMRKKRLGDRAVTLDMPSVAAWTGYEPVLLDDIISSGETMIAAAKLVRSALATPATCIAVHGLFAPGSYELLLETAKRVVTTNSVSHTSNAIDIFPALATALATVSGDI